MKLLLAFYLPIWLVSCTVRSLTMPVGIAENSGQDSPPIKARVVHPIHKLNGCQLKFFGKY